MKGMWSALAVAFLGIVGIVFWQFIEHKKSMDFHKQIEQFQMQTAVYDDSVVYKPGDTVTAEWTFDPIIWDQPVVMTATFLFKNTDTNTLYVTGEVRILPFFNTLQFQVSEPLDWLPTGKRKVTTSYTLPAQLADGKYVIQICQQFQYGNTTTTFTCYDGPVVEVRHED